MSIEKRLRALEKLMPARELSCFVAFPIDGGEPVASRTIAGMWNGGIMMPPPCGDGPKDPGTCLSCSLVKEDHKVVYEYSYEEMGSFSHPEEGCDLYIVRDREGKVLGLDVDGCMGPRDPDGVPDCDRCDAIHRTAYRVTELNPGGLP